MQKRLDVYLSENNTVKKRNLAAYLIKYEKIDGNDFKLLMEGKLTADSKEENPDENKADSEETAQNGNK